MAEFSRILSVFPAASSALSQVRCAASVTQTGVLTGVECKRGLFLVSFESVERPCQDKRCCLVVAVVFLTFFGVQFVIDRDVSSADEELMWNTLGLLVGIGRI